MLFQDLTQFRKLLLIFFDTKRSFHERKQAGKKINKRFPIKDHLDSLAVLLNDAELAETERLHLLEMLYVASGSSYFQYRC